MEPDLLARKIRWAQWSQETYCPGELGLTDRSIFDIRPDEVPGVVLRVKREKLVLEKVVKTRRPKGTKIRIRVFTRDKFTCRDCPAVFPHPDPYRGESIQGLTLGHVVPRSLGGGRNMDNLIAQCSDCNQKLGNRIWVEGWNS